MNLKCNPIDFSLFVEDYGDLNEIATEFEDQKRYTDIISCWVWPRPTPPRHTLRPPSPVFAVKYVLPTLNPAHS